MSDPLAYNKLAVKLQRDIARAQEETLIGDECETDIHGLILCSYAEVAKLVEEALREKSDVLPTAPPIPEYSDGGGE